MTYIFELEPHAKCDMEYVGGGGMLYQNRVHVFHRIDSCVLFAASECWQGC